MRVGINEAVLIMRILITVGLAVVALVGCGGDDDDVQPVEGSSWFTSVSPSGQEVECLGSMRSSRATFWCREVTG